MTSWKHIGEVHVANVFDILKVKVVVSPDLHVFKRFREYLSKIALRTVPNKLFNINSIS